MFQKTENNDALLKSKLITLGNGSNVKNLNYVKNINTKPDISISFVSKSKQIETKMNKNLGLTEKRFYELVDNLKQGNEKLFEIAFNNLAKEGIKSLKIKYRNDPGIAKDTVIDTLLTFRRRLIDGKIKYGNLKFLYHQMLNQEYLRKLKKEPNHQSLDSISIFKKSEIDSNDERQKQFKMLNKAFNKLEKPCRVILEMFYNKYTRISQIANEFGVSDVVLRKRKQRCLDKLRALVKV